MTLVSGWPRGGSIRELCLGIASGVKKLKHNVFGSPKLELSASFYDPFCIPQTNFQVVWGFLYAIIKINDNALRNNKQARGHVAKQQKRIKRNPSSPRMYATLTWGTFHPRCSLNGALNQVSLLSCFRTSYKHEHRSVLSYPKEKERMTAVVRV